MIIIIYIVVIKIHPNPMNPNPKHHQIRSNQKLVVRLTLGLMIYEKNRIQ